MKHAAQIGNRKSEIGNHAIRQATERDARDIAEIVRTSYSGLPPAHVPAEMPLFHEEHILEHLAHPETRWVVLSEQGRRVGVAMWKPGRHVSHLSMLFVEGAHQGRGYGAALLRHFERAAAEEDVDLRILTLNCLRDSFWAIRFYRHHGYAQYVGGDEGHVTDLVYWIDLCRTQGIHWPPLEREVLLHKRAIH